MDPYTEIFEEFKRTISVHADRPGLVNTQWGVIDALSELFPGYGRQPYGQSQLQAVLIVKQMLYDLNTQDVTLANSSVENLFELLFYEHTRDYFDNTSEGTLLLSAVALDYAMRVFDLSKRKKDFEKHLSAWLQKPIPASDNNDAYIENISSMLFNSAFTSMFIDELKENTASIYSTVFDMQPKILWRHLPDTVTMEPLTLPDMLP